MKPPRFAYAAPESIEEATALLAEYGDEARIIAGGQSLMPMLALRVVRPGVLIDIGHIEDLGHWSREGEALRIGAMVRQSALLNANGAEGVGAAAPLFAEAAHFIGHPATRSRGTIAGSLCHGDPAAELPVCALVLGAEMVARSSRGERRISADDFYEGALTTVLEEDEMVTEIRLPPPPPLTGYAFDELARRHGDFALVAVGCTVTLVEDGRMSGARIALGGVGETPVAFDLAELSDLRGTDDETFSGIAHEVADRVEPGSDLHASADYRRAIGAVLTRRVLRRAADRAGGAEE